jgi:type IV secretory pathway TrbL component
MSQEFDESNHKLEKLLTDYNLAISQFKEVNKSLNTISSALGSEKAFGKR